MLYDWWVGGGTFEPAIPKTQLSHSSIPDGQHLILFHFIWRFSFRCTPKNEIWYWSFSNSFQLCRLSFIKACCPLSLVAKQLQWRTDWGLRQVQKENHYSNSSSYKWLGCVQVGLWLHSVTDFWSTNKYCWTDMAQTNRLSLLHLSSTWNLIF